jgi:hypothetical protein
MVDIRKAAKDSLDEMRFWGDRREKSRGLNRRLTRTGEKHFQTFGDTLDGLIVK